MTHRQLECFLETAETLNMTKAAKELYISQPSLSEQIKKLEKELDVTLFLRKDNKLELTPAGRTLVGEIRDLFAKEEEMVEIVRMADKISSRRLTICIYEGTFQNRISELIQSFSRKYPEIKLTLRVVNWTEMNDLMYKRDYDVGFYLRTGDYEVPGSQHEDLMTAPIDILVSEKHPLAQCSRLSFEDIQYETFCFDITYRKNEREYLPLCELFEKYGSKEMNVLPAKNLEELLLNVQSGIAVTAHSLTFFDNLLLKIRSIPFPELGNMSFSLYWNEKSSNRDVSLFADFVKENF